MTQEEKELLLKDLCARLPYGVICDMWFERNPEDKITEVLKCGGLMRLMNNAFDFMAKPYLRPMSSMTNEESIELSMLSNDKFKFYLYSKENIIVSLKDYHYLNSLHIFDWLNAHHFDYRELIEKRLALEAPENIYNTKTE